MHNFQVFLHQSLNEFGQEKLEYGANFAYVQALLTLTPHPPEFSIDYCILLLISLLKSFEQMQQNTPPDETP